MSRGGDVPTMTDHTGSTYTGRVEAGGAPDTRATSSLDIVKVAVGGMNNNAYLLRCRATGDELLIDAAADADTLLGLVHPDRLTQSVTTHRHGDHWQALADVVAATGAKVLAGVDDAAELTAGSGVPVDVALADGDSVKVGTCVLRVTTLVGHTPGSIALCWRDPDASTHLFTGDSLFPGGVGRTTRPLDFQRLLHDVESKLFDRLPDDAWVYPGHGFDTTLGAERPHLAKWRARGW